MHIVFVKFVTTPGNSQQFLNRVNQQARDSLKKESDCHVFDVGLDPEDPNRIVLYEVYTDRAAFDAHLKSEHFKAFDKDVQDMITHKSVEHFERQ